VRVDAATAELLEGSFRMRGEGEWRQLIAEEDTVAPVRTLLGKPTPCVGREAQLAMLDAVLGACVDESRAGAALVVAAPGLGKTHLVHELLRPSRGRHAGIDIVYAKGDPIRAASAFGVASQILARSAGMRDSDGASERGAKLDALVARDFGEDDASGRRELLGEICGVVTPIGRASPGLRAARADAAVMADALRDVWVAWISARVARGTVLILLEDVHWADAASIRLVEAAIAELTERPLFVLATSRPDGSQLFAERFRPRGLVEVTLGPLSTSSAERLVRGALGAAIDPELVRTLTKRSGGHPFHLEELVRAVADGRGADALPDSVLGMVQARLDDLGAEARRMLRAASVFGETFRASGVAALMGDEMSERAIRARLVELVEKEMVTEDRAPAAHESVYRFRHMLLRDTAYATLAELDSSRAHRRAAAWLEEVGEADPAVLGEHYDRGRVPERAADFFRRAAAQAIARGDFERAHAHAERALSLGPEASTEAALRAIQAEILYWRGDLAAAAERAPSAVARLARGAPEWFDAVSVAVGALGQLGRNDEVAALLRDAARVDAPPASRPAHVVALCRGMTQLFWAHAGAGLGDVRTCLDALVERPEPLDAYQTGWVHRVRAEAAWLHERDMGKCLAELDASCEAFARARALRPLCLSRLNAASLTGWSGDPARGLSLVASARADAERLGSGFLSSYGNAVQGLLLAYAGDVGSVDVMKRALEALKGSPRLAFICRVVLATAALGSGDIDVADEHARGASEIKVVDDLRAAGLALTARVSVARGHADEALRVALAASSVASSCPDLELTHGMAGLALAEAHVAREDTDAAKAALTPIVSAIDAIAATIGSPEHRLRFKERPLANDAIARLARELGVA
jgi:eukaryotic-like serine/threonine-protein kinase